MERLGLFLIMVLVACSACSSTPVYRSLDQQLFDAVKRQDVDEVRLLITQGADPNVDLNGAGLPRPPIFMAIANYDLDSIRVLIEGGTRYDEMVKVETDPQFGTFRNYMPIFFAAISNSYEIVRMMIEKGYDVSTIGPSGHALSYYINRSHVQESSRQYAHFVWVRSYVCERTGD